MALQIAQRSSSKTVKTILAQLKDDCSSSSCSSQYQALAATTTEAPETKCVMLAQWATDAYYKVVISKYQGIPIICLAMRCYPQNATIQVACCTSLELLAYASQKQAIQDAGGVALVVAAMRNHPQSIQVQSAACQALRNMSLSIILLQKDHGVVLEQSSSSLKCSPLEECSLHHHHNNSQAESEILVPDLIQLLERAKNTYMTPSGHSSANDLLSILHDSMGGGTNNNLLVEKGNTSCEGAMNTIDMDRSCSLGDSTQSIDVYASS
jgi:hypothetical protein